MKKKALSVLLCCLFMFVVPFVSACKSIANNGDDNTDPPITDDIPDDGDKTPSGPDESYNDFVDWTQIDEWTPENIKYRPVTNDDILIGGYVSYCDTTEKLSAKAQLKVLSDGGLNFMPLAYTTPSFGLIAQGERVRRDLKSVDWWKKIDDEMVKRNMVYYFSTRASVGFDTEACANRDPMTNQTAIDAAKKIVPQLSNCIGYHVEDEPSYGAFDSLAAVAKKYAAIKPGMDVLVNHLPYAAGYTGTDGYYGFMKSWVDKSGKDNINVLSHDQYPFGLGGISYDFLGNMDAMRRASLDAGGIKLACFLQSAAWQGTRMPSFDEIKWSMNAYLANGFSEFMYFNYAMYPQENCSDAIIGRKGNILHKDLYDDLAAYHYQVRAMGVNCRFTDLTANTVYYTSSAVKPSAVSLLPANSEYIKLSGLNSGNGFIVSYLTNGKTGENYMVMVNNSTTAEWKNLAISTGTKANNLSKMELYNLETGELENLWKSGDSSFTLSFSKGDMKIIKLTNK